MENTLAENYKNINGWGIDADPENEPTYPMKKYNGADHERSDYQRPEQQPVDEEVLHSNERPTVSAVFGTPLPPTGLSGVIRRFAFRFSEGQLAHWFPLILADRVNVVEGIIDDIRHGQFPNIFAEKGWKAEWKYNRSNAIKKVAVGAIVTSALIWWMTAKKKKKNVF
ncbi:MAG TPA: hypothetical protein VEV83_19405 [Parafilimonas sp.]|nr:hypothetical protein [Parafilimonas sp.]